MSGTSSRPTRARWSGLFVIVVIVAFVVIGPLIWRLDPAYINPDTVQMLKTRNQGFSQAHPFGTDQLGRDIMARMMAGGQSLDGRGADGDGAGAGARHACRACWRAISAGSTDR